MALEAILVSERCTFVFNLTFFASNLSYFYVCGSNVDPDPKH